MGAVVAAALGAGPAGGAGAADAGLRDRLDRGVGRVVSPGPLAAAHAGLEGVSRCGDCHAGLRETPDARCADCHEEVARRMRDGIGWHGGFEGDCAGCHAEHRGRDADLMGLDRESFSHDLARFALRGAHREVECDACHRRALEPGGPERFHPQGVSFARCADCHVDPHDGAFGEGVDCGACHGETAFDAAGLRADARFDHERDAGFPLEGAHARAACGDCHTDARRAAAEAAERPPGRGLPRNCAGCHEDPHRGALDAPCTTCHDATRFALPDFDHRARTGFALDATHASLECGACHEDPRFAARGTECAACHPAEEALMAGHVAGLGDVAPDPHHGTTECGDCHDGLPAGARVADYARACVECHPAEYGELLLARVRLLDAASLRVETAARAEELAARRGEPTAPPALLDAIRREARALAGRGAHNPDAAERRLLALLERLHPPAEAAP